MADKHTFASLREKYPEAPAHAIYGFLFVRSIEDESPGYPPHAALGRYAIAQDICLRDDEYGWFQRIYDDLPPEVPHA